MKTIYKLQVAIILILLASCMGSSGKIPIDSSGEGECVLYIHDPAGDQTLMAWCENNDPRPFIDKEKGIEDFVVSSTGSQIFYSQKNQAGGSTIRIANRQGRKKRMVIDCGQSNCSELDYNSTANLLGFVEFGITPMVKIYHLENNSIFSYPFLAADLKFSPDGKALSFFDVNGSRIVILEIESGRILTEESQNGFNGGWSNDSQQLLLGKTNFWGGIPGVDVFLFSVNDGELELVLASGEQDIEYYQPEFYMSSDLFLAAVRNRSAGFTKQLWLINADGSIEKEITRDYRYEHSAFQTNEDYSKLAFQRYPIGVSDGNPEVLIYDFSTGSIFLVAENAAKPQWLP